jgi:hypothetical protein
MKVRSITPKHGIYYFIYDYICNLRYGINDYLIMNKIRLVAFSIGSIFGCNNLCHSPSDFYNFIIGQMQAMVHFCDETMFFP